MARINDRTSGRDLGEYKISRIDHGTRGTERTKEKVGGGEKHRENLIYVSCAYCRMYIYRHMHFRASDPRIEERRLFASRHLFAKPAVLFTYLPPRHAVCACVCVCVRRARALLYRLSLFFLPFLISHQNIFADTKRDC